MTETTTFQVSPMDRFNQELVSNGHPAEYVNPSPAPKYNLVVIGAGPAGLVAAAGAAGLGAKVALVEHHLMGGDCTNVGCVPSKCLIRAARAAADVRRAGEYGVRVPDGMTVDFPFVMERMRKLRAEISQHESVERFKALGVDVFLGHGRFSSSETVDVDGTTLRFHRAIIATGARAARPSLPGLEQAGYLTNENIFGLTELPRRLVVFGAGPIGCELSQAFRRFGSEVTIVERMGQFLSKEDPDAVAFLQRRFEQEGIHIILNGTVCDVSRSEQEKVVCVEQEGKREMISCDEILLGAGRQPNVEDLGLEEVGVEYDPRTGVKVDETLQTTNKRIFAIGDICSRYKFTHTADAAARVVIRNALFPGHSKLRADAIPWCTYTDPEIAHVGMYERDATAKDIEVDTFTQTFDDVDRAIVDGETEGMVKVHVEKGHDHILGATIVATHAGEMINEITLAIVKNIGLGELSNVIHPYPTQAEAIHKAADAYNRTRLTPFVKGLMDHVLAWER